VVRKDSYIPEINVRLGIVTTLTNLTSEQGGASKLSKTRGPFGNPLQSLARGGGNFGGPKMVWKNRESLGGKNGAQKGVRAVSLFKRGI